MSFRHRGRNYVALVDGAFDETGVWFIEVSAIVSPPDDPEGREALVDEVKRAILLGVIEETRHGRALGAKTIRAREHPLVRRARNEESLDLQAEF